jgi:hypothetical protein
VAHHSHSCTVKYLLCIVLPAGRHRGGGIHFLYCTTRVLSSSIALPGSVAPTVTELALEANSVQEHDTQETRTTKGNVFLVRHSQTACASNLRLWPQSREPSGIDGTGGMGTTPLFSVIANVL